MVPDACCYHACLATVLQWAGCWDPALVLGDTVATNAQIISGRLVFSDSFPELSRLCRARGYACERRAARAEGAWDQTLERINREQPVVALVDSFYLPYYWTDYHRTHSQHALTLWGIDTDGMLLVRDPSATFCFEGRFPVVEMSAAWNVEDRGQAWIDIDSTDSANLPSRPEVGGALSAWSHGLRVDGTRLGCIALAEYVRSSLDRYLDLTARVAEANPRLGTDERRRESSNFLRGLWNYHHTLRWTAMYLDAAIRRYALPELRAVRDLIRDVARDWLVLRNAFMKHGLAASDHRGRLAALCDARLERMLQAGQEAAARLEAAAHLDSHISIAGRNVEE